MIDLRRRSSIRTATITLCLASRLTTWLWLAIPTGLPVLVIGEGFFMYLVEAEVLALFRRIINTFPSGEFIFDAYSAPMRRVACIAVRLWLRGAAVTLRWGLGDLAQAGAAGAGPQLVEDQSFFCLPDPKRSAHAAGSCAVHQGCGIWCA